MLDLDSAHRTTEFEQSLIPVGAVECNEAAIF